MRKRKSLIAAVFSIVIISIMAGCGGGPPPPPPPPIAVSVSPSQASVPMGTTQQFTPTVTGTSNTTVTWGISGSACSGAGNPCGTVSASGLYTAPSIVPTSTVTVTATSQADSSKSGSATVTVTSNITVSVVPTSITLVINGTQQFTATVTNSQNTNVTWDVNGTVGGNATVGTVSNVGFYIAPSAVPSPATVTVTAKSQVDPSKKASASVTVSVAVQPTVIASRVIDLTTAETAVGVTTYNDSANNPIIAFAGRKTVSGAQVGIVHALNLSNLTDKWQYTMSPIASEFAWGLVFASNQKLFAAGFRQDTNSLLLSRLDPFTGQALSEQTCQVNSSQTVGRIMREQGGVLRIGAFTPSSPWIVPADLNGLPNCPGAVQARTSADLWGLSASAGYSLVSGTFSCSGGSNNCTYLRKLDASGNLLWASEKVFVNLANARVVERVENGVPVIYVAGTEIGRPRDNFFSVHKLDANGAALWANPTISIGNNSCSLGQSNFVFDFISNPPTAQGAVTVIGQWENTNCTSLDFGALVINPDGTIKYVIRVDFQNLEEAFGGAYSPTGNQLVIVGRTRANVNSTTTDILVVVLQMP